MASLIHDGDRKRIEFNGVNGGRFGIRLGKVPDREAIQFKSRIEYLTSVRIRGESPDAECSRWLANLPEKIKNKLSRAGLIESSKAAAVTRLIPFIDGYIAERTDAKERTLINLQTSRDYIAKHFDAATVLADVTPGHAEDFARYLTRPKDQKGAGLARNTARRICGRGKQFFTVAIKKRMIAENPFAGVKCRVQGSSPEREYFVSREEAAKVIAACPDAEWRLIFALSRFAGLRCPSEHLALKWSDVDWKQNRFTVHSPKTEHHEGKDHRVLPIFPELRPYLQEACKISAGKHIIATHRDSNANLRTQLHRIIKRAGLRPWPKIFHNLRSTRETELAEIFPIHVVCYWLGNSAAIAKKHYLQVTGSDYEKAAAKGDANVTRNTSDYGEMSQKNEEIKDEQEIDNFPSVARNSPAVSGIPEVLESKRAALVGVFVARQIE